MLRAIRPLNLLIVFVIGFLFIELTSYDFEPCSNSRGVDFLDVLVFGFFSVLVSAGGYWINDHFDRKADAINKPGKEMTLPSSVVHQIYMGMVALPIAVGFLVLSSKFTIAFIVLPIGLLWLYSKWLKRLPFIGNLLIAFLAIWLPLGAIVYNDAVETLSLSTSRNEFVFLLLSCSFLITFAREMVKDIEDVKGDAAVWCKTLPILAGEPFAAIIGGLSAFLSLWLWWNFMRFHWDELSVGSIVGFVLTGIALVMSVAVLMPKKEWKVKAKRSSLLLKTAMAAALLTGFFI